MEIPKSVFDKGRSYSDPQFLLALTVEAGLRGISNILLGPGILVPAFFRGTFLPCAM